MEAIISYRVTAIVPLLTHVVPNRRSPVSQSVHIIGSVHAFCLQLT